MISTETRLACQDEAMLPVFDAAIEGKQVNEAIAACVGCPVRLSCYQHGLATKSSGVFGGVLLQVSRYRPGNLCSRGHSLLGPNGRRRTDGTRACRICETASRHIREARNRRDAS